MFKFILIIIIGFGVYKFTPVGNILMDSSQEVVSSEYSFKANFSVQPEITSKTNTIPGVGKFKITTYSARKGEPSCVIAISTYLDTNDAIGYLEDSIEPAKRGLLKRFGGKMKREDYIKSGTVSGYEMELLDKKGKLVTSRVFLKKNSSYNLLCIASSNDSSKNIKFMESFKFI